MTRKQRAKHIKKFEQVPVCDVQEADDQFTIDSMSTSKSGDISLSADITSLSTCMNLPVEALEAISVKAKELLTIKGAISPAPGQDPDARMVLSRSKKRPHLVVPKQKGGFASDSECPQYVSSEICLHVVAAAEDNGNLDSHYRKRLPNVTKLATSAVPKGRGRKGSRAPPKRRPQQDVEQRFELTLHHQ